MSQQLHVPAIGTLLTLTEPWDFRLYFERRNDKFLKTISGFEGGYYGQWIHTPSGQRKQLLPDCIGKTYGDYTVKWDTFVPQDEKTQKEMELSRAWRRHRPLAYIDVCFPERTILAVDRVFIRKGLDAYDSLTFCIKKPPKLKKQKKGAPPLIITPEYEFLQKVGGGRFWAKLADVNKIVCEIT